jgi:hypothetical protein
VQLAVAGLRLAQAGQPQAAGALANEAKMMLGRKLAAAVRAMAVRREDFVVNRLVRRAAAAA